MELVDKNLAGNTNFLSSLSYRPLAVTVRTCCFMNHEKEKKMGLNTFFGIRNFIKKFIYSP